MCDLSMLGHDAETALCSRVAKMSLSLLDPINKYLLLPTMKMASEFYHFRAQHSPYLQLKSYWLYPGTVLLMNTSSDMLRR